MSDFQEYSDVVQEVRGALNPGRLKLQNSGVVFRNSKTGKVDQFTTADIEKVQWLKRARGYCIKFKLHSGHIHRYDGFKENDQDKLGTFVSKNFDTKMEKLDLSVKGWNWGQTQFDGNGLNFTIDNNLAFEVPLNNVSQSTWTKNEVTLEFHQNDDSAVSLLEMRFHIPQDPNNQETNIVEEFHTKVLENADIIQATGDAVCIFSEIQCLTPRGRYDIKIYTTFLQLHGKTYDYKVPYSSVLRLFLLPHKDGRQIFFVVSLDPPIKQGQTRYHFIILVFNKDDEEKTIPCGLGDELEERYEGKLQKEMVGPEFEIISKVFKAVTTRKITVPGNFLGNSGTPAISCSYKAATGLLYPLERGFIFLHKPPVHIRFDELAAVNFARSAGSTRSFDFDVETKAGTVYTFSSIEKDEYGKLFEFAKNKNLRMKNIGGKKLGDVDYDAMLGSDDEDGTHDAYLERMKEEGKDRDSDDMDDDSDSSDEDFKPPDSGSDVAEEYDSNPPTTSESEASEEEQGSGSDVERRRVEKRAEKEKRRAEKKEKKEKTAKTVREGPRKTKKKKKDEDPNKPKRPQSAYFIWFMETRETIKEDNPGFSIIDITKKAGELWKGMTADDKKPYEAKAAKLKEEYQVKMEEYNKTLKEEGRSEGAESKKEGKSKSKKTKTKDSSPKKSVSDSKAGAGGSYKSKEFISDSDSSRGGGDDDDEDKPLKKKKEKKPKKAKEEKMEVDESESEEEKLEGVKRRSQRKDGEESDVGSLPDEEEILSSPEHSEPGSGGEESSAADSGSGDDDEED